MTDIQQLRSHLHESSPEALERARERVLAAQGRPGADAAGARPTRLVPRSDRGNRPRHHRAAFRFGAIGLAAAAMAVVALLVGIGSGTDDGALAPAPASARTVLVRAAASAARADDGGIARLPRPDEYFYLEIRGTYRDGVSSAAGASTRLDTRTYRSWQSATRAGRIESGDGPPTGPSGRAQWYVGNERLSHAELAAFHPSPRKLYERLLRGVSPGQGSSPEAEVFVQIVDALRQVPLAPQQRATFLRALAEIPGLRLTGTTKDSLGREGLGVAYVERSRQDQQHELILGHDGALLAERQTERDGTLLQDAVVVRQAITTERERPAG